MAAPAPEFLLRHFRLLCRNRWTKFNEFWEEASSQRPLPSSCFSGRSKKQDGRLASDWLRYFRLLWRNRWTEFNEFWEEARSQRPLPSLCFSGRSEKQDGRLASDWLRYFRLLLWNCWMEFDETWQESRSKCSVPSLCFSGQSEKQDGRPGLWLAETFSTSSETAEPNSMKLDRKQDLNALYQDCVFWADWKNKMAALASDGLRHFRLLLWNRWMEFSKTWQEARS